MLNRAPNACPYGVGLTGMPHLVADEMGQGFQSCWLQSVLLPLRGRYLFSRCEGARRHEDHQKNESKGVNPVHT